MTAAEKSAAVKEWRADKKNLQVWVAPEFADEFRIAARASGRTVQAALREALTNWIELSRFARVESALALVGQIAELHHEKESVP